MVLAIATLALSAMTLNAGCVGFMSALGYWTGGGMVDAEFDKLPTGAIGLYTYYERLAQGLRQLMAGARKFTLEHMTRNDLTTLTREAEEITGIPSDEAIGRQCWEVFRASICESACALRETIRTGQPIVNKAVFIVNTEGQKTPISISTAIVYGIWRGSRTDEPAIGNRPRCTSVTPYSE